LTCERCGLEGERSRFCVGCGAPLLHQCPGCGAPAEAAQRFCGECGTALREGSTAAAESLATAADAVRKTITVLFADLGGSTGFGERNDPEIARLVLSRYHALLREVIDAHAGTVAKFMGDGMMATFGIPEVGEDDARRAVQAGVVIQARFETFAAEVEAGYGELLTLRVGINTGEVVVGEADADLIGDALNVAARLEKACRPGHVLVGDETWRLTRGDIAYEALGEVTVAGRAQPVPTFEVAEQEQSAPDEVAISFLGRDAEMSRMLTALDEACVSQSARLVTVLGSPGVGKTRLARELAQRRADSTLAFELRCDRAGEATFAPIAQLIRDAAGIGDEADGHATRTAIRRLLPDAGGSDDHARVAEVLAGLVGAAPARSVEETFWAIRRLVEAVAAERPVIVVVDDIQWAGAVLLDLLEHLVEWVTEVPVLLVALARPELREVRPVLTEPGGAVSAVIALDGLDASATEALVARMLGTGQLPPGWLDRLPVSTGGNPLFVRELVRMLVDDQILQRQLDGSWALTVAAEAVEVPPTILSLLGARVERLSEAERHLLELAAVIGADFSLGALRELAGAQVPIASLLDSMRQKELVEPTGSYWGDEPVHRFHHVLIRDAAYRRLLKTTRAALHERVADWTDRAAATVMGEHEAVVAHHYEKAHGYRVELGLLDEHTLLLGRRAAELLTTAAHRALERDDLVAAGSLSIRAVALVSDGDREQRAGLLILACECLLSTGDGVAARPLVEGLGDLAGDDPRLAAWAGCLTAQLVGLTDPDGLIEAAARGQEAAAALAALGDRSGEAKARQVRAELLRRLGRVGEAEVELDLALEAARAADDRRRLTAVLGSAPDAALFGPSPVARAGGRCLDVVRLLRISTASPSVEAASSRSQAVLQALRGRFDVARSMLTVARATFEELGLAQGVAKTDLYAGMVELIAGDSFAAVAPLRSAVGDLEALDIGVDTGNAAALLARALLVTGAVDEADELATASEKLAGQSIETSMGWRIARAEVLAARGDLARAVALAEEATEIGADTDLMIDHADACAVLADVRRLAGDLEGAATARDRAQDLYEKKGATVLAGRLAQPAPGTPLMLEAQPATGEDVSKEPSRDGDLDNPSIRVLRALWRAATALLWEDVEAQIATDVVRIDNRSGLSGVRTDGSTQYLQAIRTSFGTGEVDEVEVTPLAVGGQRLSLSRVVSHVHGFEIPMLMVVEIDDARRIAFLSYHDEDDLVAAQRVLDARS
jgi:class 3 adenylate cyclase/type II secretory pathway predicted ATPase ExeA